MCAQGHQRQAGYDNIRRGKGCPICAGTVPKTPADYHALAEERGFRWLGPQVPNVQAKTNWECAKGHQWQTSYHPIRRGTGCPVCAGKAPKTPADYYALAEERGFRWLGPEVPSVQSKTNWECAKGHRWQARYTHIRRGTGCPACAGVLPKTADDYHALAKKRSFRWLGPQVSTVQAKTNWQCEKGHQWQARYNNLRRGTGCPICARKRR